MYLASCFPFWNIFVDCKLQKYLLHIIQETKRSVRVITKNASTSCTTGLTIFGLNILCLKIWFYINRCNYQNQVKMMVNRFWNMISIHLNWIKLRLNPFENITLKLLNDKQFCVWWHRSRSHSWTFDFFFLKRIKLIQK